MFAIGLIMFILFAFSQIEEIDLTDFKTIEYFHEQDVIQLPQQNKLHAAPTMQRRKFKKEMLDLKKMMKIAESYADLHPDEVRRPSPIPKFRGPTVIQCPARMTPRNRNSHAAFLQLLHHVSRRHPESSSFLFAEISKRYAPLIDVMKRKVNYKTKKMYCQKFRD